MKFLEAIKETAIEFCSETSLHGFRYIVEPKRSLIERIFWGIVVSVAIIGTATGLYVTYINLSSISIRTSILSTNYPSFMLEQPAITICNINRALATRADMILNELIVRDGDMDLLNYSLPLFLDYLNTRNYDASNMKYMSLWQNVLMENLLSVDEFLYFLTQPCSEMLLLCHIGSKEVNCSHLVRIVRTDLGFCCSFYYKPPKDNPKIFFRHTKPLVLKTLFETGFELGHTLLMNLSIDNSVYSVHNVSGAMIYLHSQTEYAARHTTQRMIMPGKETFVRYKSSAVFGSEELEVLDYDVRKCYMKDEIKLKFFDNYSLRNCIIESDMEIVAGKCNCLVHNFPNQGFIRECTIVDEFCLRSIQDIFFKRNETFVHVDGKEMQCFEQCSYVQYQITTSFGDFDSPHTNAYQLWDGLNVTELALVHIFQVAPRVMVFHKSLSYSYWNALASLGSVGGICLGLNVLCVIEFIFSFSFQVFHHITKPSQSRRITKRWKINSDGNNGPIKIFVNNRY